MRHFIYAVMLVLCGAFANADDRSGGVEQVSENTAAKQNATRVDLRRMRSLQTAIPSTTTPVTSPQVVQIVPQPNMSASLQAAPIDATKWLFVIAIEKYDEVEPVIYATKSAKEFAAVMQKRIGISERNSYVLIGDKATMGSIKLNMERLTRNVKAGDTIYFYYSGHSIPLHSDGEVFMLPKDASPEFIGSEKDFMVRNIYKKLSDSKASKIIAFIDSCYSGRTDGVSNVKGIAAGVFKSKKVEFNTQKMVVMTAGTNGQFSNAFPEKGQRLFSYYLTRSLALRPTLDIESVYREVAVKVKDESFKMGDTKIQDPQIEGNAGLGLQ